MTNKYEDFLTIAVCSNRIEKLIKYTLPLLAEVKSFCAVQIFLDGSIREDLNSFFKQINEIGNIEIVTSKEVSGHSNLRNLVLKSCKTKYLLFLDDDITITADAVKSIINELGNNYEIVGLRLVPADNIGINKWYISPNQYHYLAVHSEFTLNTVWGACMAFSIKPIKQQNLFFDNKLGRQNNKFLGGEDTSFIAHLTQNGCKTKVIQSNFAIHHIDKSRVKFSSLIKRVFWQGITEAMRRNVKDAFSKEGKRNFSILTVRNFLLGCFWLLIFSIGSFYGNIYRVIHSKKNSI